MKYLSALALSVALLAASCGESKKEDPKPTTPTTSGISVSVRENNGTAYNLSEARVVNANYNGTIAGMTMTGKMANGKPLTLIFSTSNNNQTSNSTNLLSAYLDGVQASQATGTTTRNASTNKVTGSFTAQFSGLSVSGSFTDVQLP